MLIDKKMIALVSLFWLLFCITCQVFAQSGKPYEGPDDPAADRSALREGVMDGNQFLTVFRNNSQIGRRGLIDGSKWPKDSEAGLQIYDQLMILVGAEVFLAQDTIPVTDEAEIASRKDLDTLYFVEAQWTFEDMLDRNNAGDIVWSWHAVPGYNNELSESPAVSDDPGSWPTGGWPSRGTQTKWPKEWNGRFGRGVQYAQLESYFVANDAQDMEYILETVDGVEQLITEGPRYYPRPGVLIGDRNPDVTIQKGRPWGGLGTRVEVRGYQWENPQTRDIIFWEYNISNISDYDLPHTTFGYFVDMGVGNAFNFGDDADDLGGFDGSADMAYIWDANNIGAGGYAPGTCGITFLESPGIKDGIDNDDDGITDESRDNLAEQIVGPTDGYSDLAKFMEFYGYNSIEQLRDHWDADEDQDWVDWEDANNNNIYDHGENIGDDVGLDGVGPEDINYTGPDADGTEANHRPDLLEGLNSEPNFGLNDISESDMLGLTSYHFITWPGNNSPAPRFDKDLYSLIGIDLQLVPPVPGDIGDHAPIFGSGPFRLAHGTTERISVAMIGAYENVSLLNSGNQPYTLIEKKKIVQLIYESDYRFAKAPETPTLYASAEDDRVVLTWDKRAELFSREPLLGGENDFEGYKLYKATDRSFADAQRVFDGQGNPSGKTPIFQCDIKNEHYGYTDYGILQGETYFLGNNTGIQHSYIDEDVENGRTYYYYLVAYDRGIKGLNANIAPAENVFSILVDENENIESVSKNVQIVTPGQYAAGFIPPNIEVEAANGEIAGTGTVTFDIMSELSLKEGNQYKLSFLVDTSASFKGSRNPFPTMAYQFRNVGFTVTDVSDTNRVLIEESPANFSGENIFYEPVQGYHYLNPNIISDPFDGITLQLSDVPSEGAEYDTSRSGWVSGDAPIKVSIFENGYKWFPWQTDIVFTGQDVTNTTKSTDISAIRSVVGIVPFNGLLLMKDQSFNFYVENKNFQDSTGSNFQLDVITYDTNENGQFDLLEDDVIFGYSNMDNGEVKWQVTIGSFNFRYASSESELPNPEDVYRIDAIRPFTAADEYIITVLADEEAKENAEDLSNIKVVPNPYIVTNVMEPAVRNIFLNQRRRIMFTHIPSECTIKIFTISGYLVDKIEVNNPPSTGIVHWDLLTKDDLEIAPGIYIYHVQSNKTGKKKMGKFAIIK